MAVASVRHHQLCNLIPQLYCIVVDITFQTPRFGKLSQEKVVQTHERQFLSQLGHNGLAFENSSTKQAHPLREKTELGRKLVIATSVSLGFVNP